jgi:hypothetical protein
MVKVMSNTPLSISFRRSLMWYKWVCPILILYNGWCPFQLSDNPDTFILKIHATMSFSVNSLYLDMMNDVNNSVQKLFGNWWQHQILGFCVLLVHQGNSN